MSPVVSPKPSAPHLHNSPATQLLRETEAAGPYSHNLNDIDLDDPQTYEEIYQKKLENDYAKKEQYHPNESQNKQENTINTSSNNNSGSNLANEREVRKQAEVDGAADRMPSQKRVIKHLSKATDNKKTVVKNSSESSQVHMLETSVTNSSNATTTTTSTSSNECKCHKKLLAVGEPTDSKTSVVTTTNSSDQLINSSFSGDIWLFWKRCKKFGSRIAKSLKEADVMFKDIKNASKMLQSSHVDGNEPNMDVDMDYPKRSISCSVSNEVCSKKTDSVAGGGTAATGEEAALNDDDRNKLSQILDSMNKRLKKKLYDIANMVGINTDIGVDDGSIDSNKTDHLDSHIKKVTSK